MLLIIAGCAKPAKPNNPTEVINRFCSAMLKQNKTQLQELITGHGEEDIDFLLKFEAQTCEAEEEIIQNNEETQMFVRVRTSGFTTKNKTYPSGMYRFSIIMDNEEDYVIQNVGISDNKIISEQVNIQYSMDEIKNKLINYIPQELMNGINSQKASVDKDGRIVYLYQSYEDPMHRLDTAVRYSVELTFDSFGLKSYRYLHDIQKSKPSSNALTIDEGKILAEQFTKDFLSEKPLEFEYGTLKEEIYASYFAIFQGEIVNLEIDLDTGFVVMMSKKVEMLNNEKPINIKDDFLPSKIDNMKIKRYHYQETIEIALQTSDVINQVVELLTINTNPKKEIRFSAGGPAYEIIVESNGMQWIINDDGETSCRLLVNDKLILETAALGSAKNIMELFYDDYRVVYDEISHGDYVLEADIIPLSVVTDDYVIKGKLEYFVDEDRPELWQLAEFDWKEYEFKIIEHNQIVDSLPDTVGIHDIILENEYGTYQLKYRVEE